MLPFGYGFDHRQHMVIFALFLVMIALKYAIKYVKIIIAKN